MSALEHSPANRAGAADQSSASSRTPASIAAIAHVCHEANRALQVEQMNPSIPVSLSWEDLDEERRASAVDGVQFLLTTGAGPEASHENWVRFKLLHGWRWGPVKDEESKRHPLLVSYADLPPEQRAKDALFHAIVGALR